ncbi:hypothetical protein EYV94_04075 [Puteibacter caeruleilacunae]|nr:hypothetical protein EYV94_04075 [Puteibacter caeruleilacunae]
MWIKIISVALLASIKYLATLPYALFIGLEYREATIVVIAGGLFGFVFFFYLSGWIIRRVKRLKPAVCSIMPMSIRQFTGNVCSGRSTKKIRKKGAGKKRFIVKVKKKYGFWGLIIATPVLLSIPLGAFLANKYYRKRQHLVLYMSISIVLWGTLISSAVSLFG